MEPLVHTLTGASLAEAGLKRASPLGAATLILAANLPDIDGACYVHSADLAFAARRGWTHGVLALVLLPFVLTGVMLAVDRAIRRRRAPGLPPARPAPLLGLAFLGVLSHITMDWPNTYGVRLLMPFSGRWFYGDAIFIVDPWLWLVLGSAVMVAWCGSRGGRLAAVLLAAATTLLMLANSLVAGWAKLAWVAGIGLWLAARTRASRAPSPRLARAALVVAAAYIAAMIAGSRIAERQVRDLAAARGWRVERVAAMPVPAEPLRRTVVVVSPGEYRFVPVNWLRGPEAAAEPAVLARGDLGRDVEAAMGAPFVQGVRRWLRFPSFEVRPLSNGWRRVVVRDARFAVGSQPGFGVVAVVDLDRASVPRPGPSFSR